MNPTKHGRRSGKTNHNTNLLLETPPDLVDDNPPQVRGGWAEDGKKSKNLKSPQLYESEQPENDRISDTDDEIPVIPDMDDMQEDLLTLQEMKVPSSVINTETYKELNSELTSEESTPMITKSGDDDHDRLAFMDVEVFKKYDNFDTLDNKEEWTTEMLLKQFVKDDDVNTT